MAINRKQLLRYTGAAAAGSALGAFATGAAPSGYGGDGDTPAGQGVGHPADTARLGEGQADECRQRVVLPVRGGPDRCIHAGLPGNGPSRHVPRRWGERSRQTQQYLLLLPQGTPRCTGRAEPGPVPSAAQTGARGYGPGGRDRGRRRQRGRLLRHDVRRPEHLLEARRPSTRSRPPGARSRSGRSIKMPLLNINDVMARHFQEAPTFLSVDTEGMDLAILRSIDFGRFRPGSSAPRPWSPARRKSLARDPRVPGDAGVCRPRGLVRQHDLRRLEAALTGPASAASYHCRRSCSPRAGRARSATPPRRKRS